jgi:hypothetical protein
MRRPHQRASDHRANCSGKPCAACRGVFRWPAHSNRIALLANCAGLVGCACLRIVRSATGSKCSISVSRVADGAIQESIKDGVRSTTNATQGCSASGFRGGRRLNPLEFTSSPFSGFNFATATPRPRCAHGWKSSALPPILRRLSENAPRLRQPSQAERRLIAMSGIIPASGGGERRRSEQSR